MITTIMMIDDDDDDDYNCSEANVMRQKQMRKKMGMMRMAVIYPHFGNTT